MKLSALMDFPDDARNIYYESTMHKTMARLKKAGVSRVYLQYYGDVTYGHFWDHNAPTHRGMVETAKNLPNYSKVFKEAAKANGLESAVIMRPLEQGIWLTYSPYFKEAREYPGVQYTGGKMMIVSNFLRQNQELRVKRRSWDVDENTEEKTIGIIKLYKQNSTPSKINKDEITIYVSDDNSYYKKYTGDFNLEFKIEKATDDSFSAGFKPDYPVEYIARKGDDIEVMELGDLKIEEKYIAVGVIRKNKVAEGSEFINTPVNAISIHEKDGTSICSSPGHNSRFSVEGTTCLEAGFHFDDGFGFITPVRLDPEGEEGFFATSKGKDMYAHAALCACEPKVQEYWMKWLEKAMDDGHDMVGTRIECHAVHVDEPEAYGYNNCIKDEYYKRFGKCEEEHMDTEKIASIRGDAYTKMLAETAKRTKKRGKKFVLTLNLEMLSKPIPFARHMAYPLNVEWQWERWIKETQPDEINIRTYQMSPDFILNDSHCRSIIDKAADFGAPMTLERYVYWDFAEDYKMVKETGIFSAITLYEIDNVIQSDGKGGIVEIEPELLNKLEKLMGEN